jgi:exopolysaccharide production protein ExoZ
LTDLRALPVSPSPNHRLQIVDAFRGAACVAVVLFHSLESFPAQALSPVLGRLRTFTGLGWLGVHVFFALSGWCIAERVASASRRGEPTIHFLADRLLRIFPTYWLALLFLLALRIAALPLNQASLSSTLPNGWSGWLADLFLLNPYLGQPASLMVSWSLVYELGFYGLAALALGLHRRGLPSRLLLCIGVGLCAWPWIEIEIPAAMVLGLWPGFFAGITAWWASRGASPSRLAVGIVFFAAALGLGQLGVRGLTGAAPTTAFLTSLILLLLMRLGLNELPNNRLARGLLKLGAASYSIYLVHVTVMSPFQNLTTRFIKPSSAAFILGWMAAIAVGLLAGLVFHHQVEARLERWRKRILKPRSA